MDSHENTLKIKNRILKKQEFTFTKPSIYLQNLNISVISQSFQNFANEMRHQYGSINYSEIELLEVLGKGGFGKVIKAYHKKTGDFLALKYVDLLSTKDLNLDSIILERFLLEQVNKLKHPAFIKFHSLSHEQNSNRIFPFVFIMEYGTTTLSELLKYKTCFSEEEICYIFKGVIDGLFVAQQNMIANRDLKLENIVWIEKDDIFKIIDFGIGCLLKPGQHLLPLSEVQGFSEAYAAPEISIEVEENEALKIFYDPFKADVYSLGIMILRLMGIKKKKVNKIKKNLNFEKYASKYQYIMRFLPQMLDPNYEKRLSFEELKKLFENSNVKKPKFSEFLPEIKIKIQNKENLASQLDDYFKFIEVYQSISSYEQALIYANKAFETVTSDLSLFDELKLAKCFYEIGKIYNSLSNYEKAEEFHLSSLKIKEVKQGIFTEEYLDSLIALSKNYSDNYVQKQLIEKKYILNSRQFAIFAYHISIKMFGEINTHTADCLHQIGNTFYYKRNFIKAHQFYQKSYSIKRFLYGEINSKVADSLVNFGNLIKESKAKPINDAINYYNKALEIYKLIYGEYNPKIELVLHNLSLIYSEIEDSEKTLFYFEKKLVLILKIYGNEHKKSIETTISLANLFWDYNKPIPAMVNYMKVYKIIVDIFGENEEQITNVFNGLGNCYTSLNNYKKALKCYQKCLQISLNLFGENKYNISYYMHNVGNSYSKLQQDTKTIHYFEKAYHLYDKFIKEMPKFNKNFYENYINLCKNMGIFLVEKKKMQKAERMFFKKRY